MLIQPCGQQLQQQARRSLGKKKGEKKKDDDSNSYYLHSHFHRYCQLRAVSRQPIETLGSYWSQSRNSAHMAPRKGVSRLMLQVCTDQTNKKETCLLESLSGSGGWTLATGKSLSGCHRLPYSPKHYQMNVTGLAVSLFLSLNL